MSDNFNWSDLTIEQFTELIRINDMKCNETDKCVQILCLLTDNTDDYYLDMPLPDLIKEFKHLEFITKTVFEPIKPKFGCGEYTIDGIKYILTPSSEKMTGGQFIDYKMVMDERPDDVAMLCATVLIPDGKTYGDGYDPLALRDIIYSHMSMAEAKGISFFFQKMYETLLNAMIQSSSKKIRKAIKTEKDMVKKEVLRTALNRINSTLYGIK